MTSKNEIDKSKSKSTKKSGKSFHRKNQEVIRPQEYFPRNNSFEFNNLASVRKIDINKKEKDKKKFNTKLVSNKKKKELTQTEEDIIQQGDYYDIEKFNNLVKFDNDQIQTQESRVFKPKFDVGDLILVCISEIFKDYMIGNYTRNKKALIHRKDTYFHDSENFSFDQYFSIGQFVSAAVITPEFEKRSSSGNDKHYKIKCSIEPHIVNHKLEFSSLVEGMDLWGQLRFFSSEFYPYLGFRSDEKITEIKSSLPLKEESYAEEDDEEESINEEEDNELDEEEEDEYNEEEDEKVNKMEIENKNYSKKNKNNDYSFIFNKETQDQFKTNAIKPFTYHFFKIIKIRKENEVTTIEVTFSSNTSQKSIRTRADIAKLNNKNSEVNLAEKYNCCLSKERISLEQVRPGMIFSCINTKKDLQNGIEVTVGSLLDEGYIFIDHLVDFNSSNKKEEFHPKKVYARVIHVSHANKHIGLSAKENIIWLNTSDSIKKKQLINSVFSKQKDEISSYRKLFGDSYIVKINEMKCFFHYSHLIGDGVNKYKSQIKQLSEKIEEKKKSKIKEINLKEDIEELKDIDFEQTLHSKLRIKEYNFFDNIPHLILDKGEEIITWESIQIGKEYSGKIKSLDDKGITININKHIKGLLSNKHISDVPLVMKNLKKFKEGQVVKVTCYDVKPSTKKLLFTMKPGLLPFKKKEEICLGMVIKFVYLDKDLFEHCGGIRGKLLNFKEENKTKKFKSGCIYQLKIVRLTSHNRMILSNKDEEVLPEKEKSKKDNKDKINKLSNKNKITVGSLVEGLITSIKGCYIFVYLSKNTIGKIHINNCCLSLKLLQENLNTQSKSLTQLKRNHSSTSESTNNLLIKAKILNITNLTSNINLCELISQDMLLLLENKLDNKFYPSKDLKKITKEEKLLGIVAGISPISSYPIKIHYGRQIIQKIGIPFYNLSHELFIPGDVLSKDCLELLQEIHFFSKNDNHSLIPIKNKEFKKQGLYPARILKSVQGKGLVASLYLEIESGVIDQEKSINGFIDITEITDYCVSNPLDHFPLGSIILVRVLEFDTSLNKYILSSRASIVNQDTFDKITNGSSTVVNNILNNNPTDLRNKIFKFGNENVLEQNQIILGWVTQSSKNGVFVRIGLNTTLRAPINEITDDKIFEPFNLIQENQLVLCRIISKTYDKQTKLPRFNISLRESVVKFNLNFKLKDLNIKCFYNCLISGTNKENKFVVNIIGSTYNGILSQKANYNIGDIVVLQLVECNKEIFPPSKMVFSNTHSEKDTFDRDLIVNKLTEDDLKCHQIVIKIWQEVASINLSYKQRELSKDLIELEANNDIDFENNLEVNYVKGLIKDDEELEEDQEEQEEQVDDQELHSTLEDDENDDEVIYDHDKKLKILGLVEKSSRKSSAISNNSNQSLKSSKMEIDDNENKDEEISKKKLKSSQKREKHVIKEEKAIREKEKEILQNKDEELNSVESFEKSLLKDMNNSELWIMYAAYILKKANYKAAKAIFERAVKTIDITELKEKMSLWVAYLNFENMYGNQDEFTRIAQEAVKVNDKKQIYKHLILIYKKSGNLNLIFEGFRTALKSFKNDLPLWKNFLEFAFSIDSQKHEIEGYIEIKELLSQALQSLIVPAKRIELMIHYASLHYKYDKKEQGRTVFEALIKEHPKRSDIWLVYLDKEAAYPDSKFIFKKCLEKDHKSKVLKQVVAKYLDYEKKHGSKDDLEKAMKYVSELMKTKIQKLEEEVSDEENN